MLRSLFMAVSFTLASCSQIFPVSTGAGVRASAAHGDEVLILFDDTGPYAELGELYATGAAILVSHFARWRMLPASRYRAGDLLSRRAAVYIGTTYDAPLPAAFLDDVLSGDKPVLWIDENIWQLARHRDDFARLYGFKPTVFSADRVQHVIYKGVHLDRQTGGGSDVMHFGALDPSKVRVLAWAESEDGRQLPWGLQARNLFYIGENPFVFIGATDRYLAFCDLLFDLLAPGTPERHRALLRIEDVHPETSPEMLRAIADYLVSQKVPYSVAVVPVYVDPKGAENAGRPEHVSMRQAPEFVAALRYMQERGATLVLHGYTHQYGSIANPYNGVTGDDFEFYRAHIDEHDNVIQTGPVAEDSAAWALDRVERAFAEFDAVGLPRPSIFEYPHYAGSAIDSRALAKRFEAAYHRGTYFGRGSGGEVSYARSLSLFFPYVVRDIYGWKVIPENVGNYIPVGYNNNSQRSVRDMVHIAEVNRVVRDGFASMFYHPVFKLSVLRDIVEGVRAAGYEFVSVDQL